MMFQNGLVDTTVKGLWLLLSLVSYAVVFTVIPNIRISRFVDWGILFLLIYFLEKDLGGIAFILLIIPFINTISNKIKVIETTVISSFFAVYGYFLTKDILTTILIITAFLLIIFSLSINFSRIGVLEQESIEIRKIMSKLTYENSKKDNQVERVSKLFYRKKKLEKITSTMDVEKDIVETSNEMFNADYSVLYKYTNGIFKKAIVEGDTFTDELENSIVLDKGRKLILNKKTMQIPINFENNAWGVIIISGKKARIVEEGRKVEVDFEETDLELMTMYLESAMSKISDLKLTDKLTEAAYYDRLTAVPNRAFLEKDLLEKKYAYMRQERKPISVLIIDIDNFKSFNDTFGHNVGDEVLKNVARIATESLLDPNDNFGRWGGEEFVAYLIGSDQEVYRKAEHIRRSIEEFDFEHRKITISGGIATFIRDGKNLKEVIEAADKALYYSKETGKNKITIYQQIKNH